ncbi:MAG: hypothetical protein ACJASV_003005 [Pseudorhodobacter sp.]|jgi:hypothetical protein
MHVAAGKTGMTIPFPPGFLDCAYWVVRAKDIRRFRTKAARKGRIGETRQTQGQIWRLL